MADTLDQDEETRRLKEQFGAQVKVIKDVGDFTHVVNFRPENLDLAVKLQLTSNYPKSAPDILVQSKLMHEAQVGTLKEMLSSKAASSAGTNVLSDLLDSAMQWVKEQGLDAILQTATEKGSGAKSKGKKKTKHPKTKEDPAAKDDEKKSSMKTAEDVISRIRWDKGLNSDDFTVGYVDRFLGVVEKKFSSFSWEDIASVDYTVLAIPKHRIQHFKYKDVKVWDKATRLDNMFGSTGSGITITEVITKYEELSAKSGVKPEAGVTVDTDNDSDDDIEINVGNIKEKSFVDISSDDEANLGQHWENKLRPNYFVCVRITDPEVREGVALMQDYILDNEPRYAECVVPPAALHVTLCTLGLDTQDQLVEACRILREAQPELSALAQKHINLHMKGVSHFYNRVLYAVVHHDDKLTQLVDHVRLIFSQAGLEIRDAYDFVPHMTIMKTTRPVSRAMKTKDISQGLYDSFTDMQYGYQTVDALFLCPMTSGRREDGFYETPLELSLM